MKKFSTILYALAALSLAAVSCNKVEETYEPGEADVNNCYGVYFPSQAASGDHTYDPTQDPTVEFTVARYNTSGAITVPVKYTESETGMFQVGTLSFADGQKETTLKVDFPKTGVGTKYEIAISVDDPQYVSSYLEGAHGIDFSVLRVEWIDFLDPKTGQPAVITFNEGWWGEVHTATMKYYEVNNIRTCVATCNEGTGIWGDSQGVTFDFIWYLKNNVEVDGELYNMIQVKKQYLGWDYAGWASKPVGEATNPVYFYDWYNYWIERGESLPEFVEFAAKYQANYPTCYYDGNGGFYFTLKYYIPSLGGGFSSDNYDVEAIASGFSRPDYTFDMDPEFSEDGVLPVYFEVGKDLTKIAIAAYEGELTPTQVNNKVAAIEAGTETVVNVAVKDDFTWDEDYELYWGYSELSFDKTATYTIVAVASDEAGVTQATASAVAPYVTAADVDKNEVDIHVAAERVPERYEAAGYDNISSIAYYIYGTKITECRVAIAKTSAVTSKLLSTIKYDTSGKYNVSDEVLEQINAAGGFYTLATRLAADTDYTVVVWATNGMLETIATASIATDPKPITWNSLGKGQYTDDVACGLYGIDPQIEVEVDVYEDAARAGYYKISNFSLPIAAAAFSVTTEVMSSYEGKYWRAADLEINATDPASVTIALQDYGVCLNASDGFIDGVTSLNPNSGAPFSKGLLADGVITFPTAKGLLITLNGKGYYYANQHGTFKLVLPSAVKTSVPAYTVKRTWDAAEKQMFAPVQEMRFERDAQSVEFKAVPGTGNFHERKTVAPREQSLVKGERMK